MEKIKVLVADKLSKIGLEWLKSQEDVELTNAPIPEPAELARLSAEHDGMIIRSGVKITADILANPGRLKAIARAGVGVDNVDVPVATEKGVIVSNTPGGNTLATAELTMTLILALSRKIAPANASLREGKWDRKNFEGTQLAGKTIGIIGMGRIGRAVAQRAASFEMRVLGYDPFFAGSAEGDVEMVKDLADICKRADYITVHVPKSGETLGMIGAEQLAMMKPTVRLVNAARGGIIDPKALLEALNAGKVAGAAIDVYLKEPPDNEAEKALIQHPAVLAVPHLGASTAEAQEQVALEAAQQLVEALRGGEVKNAVNAPGFDKALPAALRPYAELATRMGMILSSTSIGPINKVEVIYRGAIADMNVAPITTHLLVGLIQPFMDIPVNVINAPVLARQRGLDIETITSAKVKEFTNMMEVTVCTDTMKRSVKGTIFGNRFPRIIAIDGYRMEMKPEGHLLIIFNEDKPGVVGNYGSILGKNNLNIADMTFSRKMEPKMALVGMNLDSEPSSDVLTELKKLPFVHDVYYLHMPVLYQPQGTAED